MDWRRRVWLNLQLTLSLVLVIMLAVIVLAGCVTIIQEPDRTRDRETVIEKPPAVSREGS